jgi:hypothetical protein
VLFFPADKVYGLSHDMIRIYAGHLSIFLTRARGPFWSRPAPTPILLAAVIGTQAIAHPDRRLRATMTPLGGAGPVSSGPIRCCGSYSMTGSSWLLTTGSTTTRAAKTETRYARSCFDTTRPEYMCERRHSVERFVRRGKRRAPAWTGVGRTAAGHEADQRHTKQPGRSGTCGRP